MLVYQNKLEVMNVISVYNKNRYVQSAVDSARWFKVDCFV